MEPLEDWSVCPKYVPPASEPVTIDPPSRNLTVRLERALYARLSRLAYERGCFRQEVVREAVERYLDEIGALG